MLTHYLKLAQKALRKNAYYTLINVFGLVCGTLAALIIANYIGHALQEDNFHENKERIYAISQTESVNNNPEKASNSTYWGLGTLMSQYPEVQQLARSSFHVGSLVKMEDNNGNVVSHIENRIQSADSNFLKVFTFPLLQGDRNTALSQSNTMVITKTAANKYFGDADPVGQALMFRVPWGREDLYKITGVLADLPANSRFSFDFLLSYAPVSPDDYWTYPSHNTYALLNKNTDPKALADKLAIALEEEVALKVADKKVVAAFGSIGAAQLSDTEYLLVLVGIFILLISWVNYFNQIIAQSYARSKQVGVLKVLGASKQNLQSQFAFESALLCLIALVLTIGIYLIIEPSLQAFTDNQLLALTAAPTAINVFFLSLFTIGITLAALLPMIIFSSQNSGTLVRNVQWDKVGKLGLRKSLVVVQFSLSTVMIISIFVISNQLNFMENKDKGMNMDDVLIVKAPILGQSTWKEKTEALRLFKQECASLPFVRETANSSTVASEEYRNETYIGFQDSKDKVLVHQNGIDENYFELYDVEFVAGNNFLPKARFKNRKSIILNESAARNLGINNWEQAIGSKIVDEEAGDAYELVGIVKDYHKTSLKYQMGPTAFKFNTTRGHFSLKVNSAGMDAKQLDQGIQAIQTIWQRVYRDAAFNYFFLDQQFAKQDAEDRNFGLLFQYFTALSIVISCLGLFSLSLFISIKRQKEIGVRKVFGASIGEILLLFYKSYLTPLLVAIVIGAPLAVLLMNQWLQNYAYRTTIGVETIGLALLSLSLIFLLTVSYHIVRSSLLNPVKVLKRE